MSYTFIFDRGLGFPLKCVVCHTEQELIDWGLGMSNSEARAWTGENTSRAMDDYYATRRYNIFERGEIPVGVSLQTTGVVLVVKTERFDPIWQHDPEEVFGLARAKETSILDMAENLRLLVELEVWPPPYWNPPI